MEFVFCASQNTMAVLIGGVTLHSYHKITHQQRDGTNIVVGSDDKKNMSEDFLRYQALRFLFIDEFSTAGIEIFAKINHKISTHIRQDGTWSLRKKGEGYIVF